MRTSEVLRHLRNQQATPGARPRLLHRYAAFLPLTEATPPLSLGEGATPLVHARGLGRELGIPELHLKIEGANPTGSFKDRGMVVAVAKALEAGARAIICASTGNTSASAAAYGAAAGLEVIVVLPAGRIAAGKLVQAQIAGARVVAVEGNFDDALRIVREMAEHGDRARPPADPRQLGQSTSHRRPEDGRLRGHATTSAARPTTWPSRSATPATSRPTGGASATTSEADLVETRPVMLGFQAAGRRAASSSAIRSMPPRPWRPPSASAIRPAWRWR